MEQLLDLIQQYVDRHRSSAFPFFSKTAPYEPERKLYKGIYYHTFLENRYFDSDQTVIVAVEQITDFDKKHNLYWRQKDMHNHEFFELFYVYSGSCICTIEDTPVKFQQGDIGLYSPKAIHCVQTPGDEDVIINVLIRKKLFDQTFLSLADNNDLIAGFFIDALYNPKSNQKYVFFKKEQMTVSPWIVLLMLHEYQRDNIFCQRALTSYMMCLLSDLACCYTNRLPLTSMPRNSEIDITSLLSYINTNCQTVTIEKLAEQFHYSVRTVSSFIQRETGKTFRQLLQSYRLQLACRYLTKTDIPLSDLSELVGYLHRSSFERSFKKYFHITPAQYRRTYQQK